MISNDVSMFHSHINLTFKGSACSRQFWQYGTVSLAGKVVQIGVLKASYCISVTN